MRNVTSAQVQGPNQGPSRWSVAIAEDMAKWCRPQGYCGFKRLVRSAEATEGSFHLNVESATGSGALPHEVGLEVTIPAGVDDGMRVRLAGEGQASPDGGPSGDAYCFIQVRPHSIFRREGSDLAIQVPLSYSQAVLGTEIEIPTLGGKKNLQIPGGTQSGEVFELRGLGMPDPRNGARGDLLVQTFVEIPKRVSGSQEELLRTLATLEEEHVTPHRKSFFERVFDYFRAEDSKSEIGGLMDTSDESKPVDGEGKEEPSYNAEAENTENLATEEVDQLYDEIADDQEFQAQLEAAEPDSPEKRALQAEREVLMIRAEMENFRKRMQRDSEQQLKYANMGLMRDLLEVVDNLQRAVGATSNADSGESAQALVDGVGMVSQQLSDVLAKHGCNAVEALGKPFDPNFHEAISQLPSDEFEKGVVMNEVGVGYVLHDRVVRPSHVVVSNGSAE